MSQPDLKFQQPRRIALVGEAWGAQEERVQKPFVGQAGQLLDRCLQTALIARSDCLVTNVFNARPRDNDVSIWLDLSRKNVTPTQFYRDQLVRLKLELETTRPNVVVALGAVALYALTGLKHIMKWRGSVLESTLIPGLKVIPTIHPAAALRQYVFQYSIIFDFKRARREAESPVIMRRERTFITRPTLPQIVDYLEECKKAKLVSFDIEVLNQQVNCIGFSHSSDSALCIPFLDSFYRNYWAEVDEFVIWRLISEVLEDPNIPKVAQNGIFDTTFLATKCNVLVRGHVADTMFGFHLLYPDLPKGLDYITSIFTNEPYYKDEGKHWSPAQDWEMGWTYNCKDAAVTLEAWKEINSELSNSELSETLDFTMRLSEVLTYMNLRGVRIEKDSIRQYVRDSNKRCEELEKELTNIAGFALNPHSPKQLATYFYIHKGEKAYLSRQTGQTTVNDEALTRLSRKGYKEAELIQEIRGLRKLSSTYLDIEVDQDGRMRCSYNPSGTTTGRLSSSKTIFGTGTNLQNVPKEARQFIIPDPGHLLIELDLSQAEARVVAYLAGDPTMMNAFETKQDIHSISAKLFGSDRRIAKTVNHASNYDMGFRKLALLLSCPEAEAKRLLDLYHSNYPGIRNNFHQAVQRQLRKNRTLTNLFGRKRTFMERWSDDLFRQAYAFIPQSTVVDVLNQGLIELYHSDHYDLLLQVHDSILFQVRFADFIPRRILDAKKFVEIPIHYQGRSFVIPAEFKIGLNWRDMETINVENPGRLVDSLREVYGKLGTTEALSHLDWLVSNSWCTPEENLS